jgi:transcriptional regulator
MGDRLPLLKGTLDLLILKALSCEPMHGYGLATWLEGHSDGDLVAEDSALYQALHRLEARRLVEAEWGVTENNRRVRWYRLSAAGREHLRNEAAIWHRYADSVRAILSIEPATGGGVTS